MEINVRNNSIVLSVRTKEDAHIDECLDAFVSALLADGYAYGTIKDALENKKERMCMEIGEE